MKGFCFLILFEDIYQTTKLCIFLFFWEYLLFLFGGFTVIQTFSELFHFLFLLLVFLPLGVSSALEEEKRK